jgi:hypothetical protein
MDLCQQKRRRRAASLVIVFLWLVLLFLTVNRFFRLGPGGLRLMPRAAAGIRPGWESISLALVLLVALGEYLAVTFVVHVVSRLLARARENRARTRR